MWQRIKEAWRQAQEDALRKYAAPVGRVSVSMSGDAREYLEEVFAAFPYTDEAKQWSAKGTDSQTGEGVELSNIQQAFIDAGAVQCGFCTPGLLVAADEMLERNPNPTDADIREALSSNLCRCTGYEKIMDAVRLAAARQGEAV